MHTPDCEDPLDWWPEAAPSDITVSTLPTPGAVTNPIRLPGAGKWVGVWGPFSGLRVGIGSNGQSYPVTSGSAFPYPKNKDGSNIDLFLSGDTGAGGTLTIARFRSFEAAQAFAGRQNAALSSTGRAKVEDSFGAPLSVTSVNTNLVQSNTVYTVPTGKVSRVFLFGEVSAFTGAATLEVRRSGGAMDQYTTAAVGNLFRNLGPFLLVAGATLEINTTVGGVGTLLVHPQVEERPAE